VEPGLARGCRLRRIAGEAAELRCIGDDHEKVARLEHRLHRGPRKIEAELDVGLAGGLPQQQLLPPAVGTDSNDEAGRGRRVVRLRKTPRMGARPSRRARRRDGGRVAAITARLRG
jgi:hypothetical protein